MSAPVGDTFANSSGPRIGETATMAGIWAASTTLLRSATGLSQLSSSSVASSSSSRLFHTTSLSSSWGGGKLKTHQGTAKRFRPISKRRPRLVGHEPIWGADGELEGIRVVNRGDARPGPLFKRGQTGKRHLNLMVNGSRLNSLGGTTVVGQGKGRIGWHLRRLMGNNV